MRESQHVQCALRMRERVSESALRRGTGGAYMVRSEIINKQCNEKINDD